MRYAILADIHGNLEAFEAVLKDSTEQRCTHYALLGDFVGYCADPKACVDKARAMNAPCVKGNHDEYCATELPLEAFNPRAAELVRWTRKQLTKDDRRWLGGLEYVRVVENFTLVHATLNSPQTWEYAFDKLAAASSFERQNTQICFFGHTHVPMAFVRDDIVRGGTFVKLKIEPGKKYFINAGAVGQPRDNNPKAAYVIYDLDQATVELRRTAYDIEATRRKIREAGLGLQSSSASD